MNGIKKKRFIVTVDTEGDGQWSWHDGDKITVQNAEYIERFQLLCEKYGYQPTYLVNYEMANAEAFVQLAKEKVKEGKCEIGMHLHAWNTPPEFHLPEKYSGQPFITEYPKDIIMKKHSFLKDHLEEIFETTILSYRSGRWATNEELFDVLQNIGIKVDCSITPGINFISNHGRSVASGNNYRGFQRDAYFIRDGLLEVPMTTIITRGLSGKTLRNRVSHLLKGREEWLRPVNNDFEGLKAIVRANEKDGVSHLEFMIHSSELMPGGSPYFKNEEDIEHMYSMVENFFEFLSNTYEGATLSRFADEFESE